MDPLTALSLAGTIVQFVDFGVKLLAEGKELYKSTTGTLTANEELELATTDLHALIDKVRKPFQQSSSVSSSSPTKEDQESQERFDSICREAAKIAEELVEKLDKIKRRGSKNRGWVSLKQVLVGAWSKGEIEDLKARLACLRKALETRILFSIRDNLNAASVRSCARFDALDEQTQRIITILLNQSATVSNEIIITLAQLFSRLEAVNDEQHRLTRDAILGERRRKARSGEVHGIVAGIEMLSVSDDEESRLRCLIQTDILKSLRYSTMTNRYENVVDAYPETFEWAFHDAEEYPFPWSNLPQWLMTGNGLYWISGKAGSGKSTLMKHILDDRRTHQFLSHWAEKGHLRSAPLCLATFFFWNSGTAEQKSQVGLLRSLLYQVLEQYPDLIPLTFPYIWARRYSAAIKSLPSLPTESWTLKILSVSLKTIIQQSSLPLKICFLIDGLDEFEGDHDDIVDLFKKAAAANSSYIKACVSSRPWVVFQDSFRDCPSLRLQDLTERDIVHYVTDRFHRNEAFQKLQETNKEQAQALILEIVKKADGVFLWVRIAVKSLLDGIRNQDDIGDLQTRLGSLPPELEPLYQHLISGIESLYLIWASEAFQILRLSRELNAAPFGNPLSLSTGSALGVTPLSLFALYLALNPKISVEKSLEVSTQREINLRCHETQIRLAARCAGLLEASLPKSPEDEWQNSLVQYLHRTARDFLETDTQWSKMLALTAKSNFDPCLAMMRSCIGRLRSIFLQFAGQPNLGRDMGMINKLAADTMIYAYHAELRGAELEVEVALLDELEKLMTKYATPLHAGVISHWSQRLVALVSSQQPQMDFLGLATVYCLAAYVTEKLKHQTTSNSKCAASDLLNHLNSKPQKHMLTCCLPLPTTAMVSSLELLGAESRQKTPQEIPFRFVWGPRRPG